RLAILRPEERPKLGQALRGQEIDARDRQRVGVREPDSRGSRGRHRQCSEILRAESRPERVGNLGRLPQPVELLLDDLLVGEHDGILETRLLAAAGTVLRNRRQDEPDALALARGRAGDVYLEEVRVSRETIALLDGVSVVRRALEDHLGLVAAVHLECWGARFVDYACIALAAPQL